MTLLAEILVLCASDRVREVEKAMRAIPKMITVLKQTVEQCRKNDGLTASVLEDLSSQDSTRNKYRGTWSQVHLLDAQI